MEVGKADRERVYAGMLVEQRQRNVFGMVPGESGISNMVDHAIVAVKRAIPQIGCRFPADRRSFPD